MFCLSLILAPVVRLIKPIVRRVKRFLAKLWLRAKLPRLIGPARGRALNILKDPDDADDAVARAVFRIQRLPYVPNHLESYLFCAVRNCARDILRERARRLALCVDILAVAGDLEDSSPSPLEHFAGAQRAAMVRGALGDLGPDERNAVLLHYFHSLSIPETAERLGLDLYRAQNVLARARRELGRILRPKLLFS
jgi:RNA polymerase sigma factor (sigma-70 family)